jgi:ABC-type uncharacterized transport system permease subunit
MRFKNAFVTVIALLLSLTVLTGLIHSEQFQQAAVVERGSFDVLAHYLFDGLNGASTGINVQGGTA